MSDPKQGGGRSRWQGVVGAALGAFLGYWGLVFAWGLFVGWGGAYVEMLAYLCAAIGGVGGYLVGVAAGWEGGLALGIVCPVSCAVVAAVAHDALVAFGVETPDRAHLEYFDHQLTDKVASASHLLSALFGAALALLLCHSGWAAFLAGVAVTYPLCLLLTWFAVEAAELHMPQIPRTGMGPLAGGLQFLFFVILSGPATSLLVGILARWIVNGPCRRQCLVGVAGSLGALLLLLATVYPAWCSRMEAELLAAGAKPSPRLGSRQPGRGEPDRRFLDAPPRMERDR